MGPRGSVERSLSSVAALWTCLGFVAGCAGLPVPPATPGVAAVTKRLGMADDSAQLDVVRAGDAITVTGEDGATARFAGTALRARNGVAIPVDGVLKAADEAQTGAQ